MQVDTRGEPRLEIGPDGETLVFFIESHTVPSGKQTMEDTPIENYGVLLGEDKVVVYYDGHVIAEIEGDDFDLICKWASESEEIVVALQSEGTTWDCYDPECHQDHPQAVRTIHLKDDMTDIHEDHTLRGDAPVEGVE